MRDVLAPHQITPRETTEFAAGVLFLDLDETITLDQAINGLSVEEIAALALNEAVLAKIEQANAAGAPVVMVTRNNGEWIERFFQARPEMRGLFTDTLACPTGNKSDAINLWLKARDIPPELAAFADDLPRERSDVANNVQGSKVVAPGEIGRLTLRRALHARHQIGHLLAA